MSEAGEGSEVPGSQLPRRPTSRARWPIGIFAALLTVTTSLVVTNLVLYTHLRVAADPANEPIGGWYRMFDVGGEANLPTWYSTALWLLAAGVVGCYSLVAAHRRPWWFLAVVCVVLSADEAAQFHEQLNLVGNEFGAEVFSDVLLYPWLLPGVVVAIVIAAVFVRPIWSLPFRQRMLVIASGALFVGGAIMVENLGAFASRGGGVGIPYVVLTALEEALEMTAVALFACTLMTLMTVDRGRSTVRIEAADRAAGRIAATSHSL